MKEYVLPALFVVGAVVVIALRINHRLAPATPPSPASVVTSDPSPTSAPPPQPPTTLTAAVDSTSITIPSPSPTPSPTPSPHSAAASPSPALRAKTPKPAKLKLPDPPAVQAARAALASVGEDPDAEAVWMDTINDPATPAEARNDLIEDLNQDGFDDPKHLTPDDLPLIESRIALVEQLGPNAMDDTNTAAFQEAYKDLLNMEARLLGPAQ